MAKTKDQAEAQGETVASQSAKDQAQAMLGQAEPQSQTPPEQTLQQQTSTPLAADKIVAPEKSLEDRYRELEHKYKSEKGMWETTNAELAKLKEQASTQDGLQNQINSIASIVSNLQVGQLEALAGSNPEAAERLAAGQLANALQHNKLTVDDPRLSGLKNAQAQGMPALKQLSMFNTVILPALGTPPATQVASYGSADAPASNNGNGNHYDGLQALVDWGESLRKEERDKIAEAQKQDGAYSVLGGQGGAASKKEPQTRGEHAQALLDTAVEPKMGGET